MKNNLVSRRNFCSGLSKGVPIIFLANIPAFFNSCIGTKKNPVNTPPAPDMTLDLTDPRYSSLNTPGSSSSIKIADPNNSTRPMIVSRLSQTEAVAYSSQCTFDGTEVPIPVNNVSTCPTCGSQFNQFGKLVRGPASTDLTAYKVSIVGQNILISFS